MTRNHAGEESVKPCWALLMICVMIGCVAVIILMVVLSFRWFTTPVATTHSSLNGECGFNSFVIGFAIVLFVAGLGLQIMATSRTGNGSVVTALWVGACVPSPHSCIKTAFPYQTFPSVQLLHVERVQRPAVHARVSEPDLQQPLRRARFHHSHYFVCRVSSTTPNNNTAFLY